MIEVTCIRARFGDRLAFLLQKCYIQNSTERIFRGIIMKPQSILFFFFLIFVSMQFACQDSNDDKNHKSGETESGNKTAKTKAALSSDFIKILNDGNAEAIPDLIAQGFNPNDTLEINQQHGEKREIPPLHCMVSGNCNYDKNILTALVKNGANINKKFSEILTYLNDTPLIIAVENKNVNAVEDLLNLGADPNILSDKDSALHLAIQKLVGAKGMVRTSLIKIAKVLINNSSTDLKLKDNEGHTPLYYAYHYSGQRLSKDMIETVMQ